MKKSILIIAAIVLCSTGKLFSQIIIKDPANIPCLGTPVGLWIGGPNKLTVNCPLVKVGIGTQNPTHHLHTTGPVLFNSTLQVDYAMYLGASTGFGKFHINNTQHGAAISIDMVNNSSNYTKGIFMEYSNATTEIMKVHNPVTGKTPFILNASGQMIIDNGSQRILQLNSDGLLRARKIRVDAETWADFVFESDYKLMPLNDLADFVKQQKHLPNVPSAKAVEEEGIDLANMNKVLLQKVEELTLYLLDEHKKNKALQAQLNSLESLVKETRNK